MCLIILAFAKWMSFLDSSVCFGMFFFKKQIYEIWMIHENYPLHADVSSSMKYVAAKYL